MMNIALDYDHTYTADPILWKEFCVSARSRGHRVYIVTARDEEHPIPMLDHVDRVYYTRLKAKRAFMENRSIEINIWIDDKPDYIVRDWGLDFSG